MEWDPDRASNTVRGQAGVQYRPATGRGRQRRLPLPARACSSSGTPRVAWRLDTRVAGLRAAGLLAQGQKYDRPVRRLRVRRLLLAHPPDRAALRVQPHRRAATTPMLLQLELKGLSSVGFGNDAFLRERHSWILHRLCRCPHPEPGPNMIRCSDSASSPSLPSRQPPWPRRASSQRSGVAARPGGRHRQRRASCCRASSMNQVPHDPRTACAAQEQQLPPRRRAAPAGARATGAAGDPDAARRRGSASRSPTRC